MKILMGIAEGFGEIRAHKFRSFLTMLGVVLGVASLLAMFALTAGIAKGYREVMSQMGGLERVKVRTEPVPSHQESIRELSPGRTYKDAQALRRNAPLLSWISPELDTYLPVRRADKTESFQVIGVEEDYLHTERHNVEHGRFLSDKDRWDHSRVCVIGRGVVERLWDDPEGVPLGESVRIGNEIFRVVGIFQRYESDQDKKRRELKAKHPPPPPQAGTRSRSRSRWSTFRFKNDVVVVPITTFSTVFKNTKQAGTPEEGSELKLDDLNVQVADLEMFEEALAQIRQVLMVTHRGIEDFSVETRQEMFDEMNTSLRNLHMSFGLIAGISLLVGGIGIMNIMLASISERIREIGIRRAVGARSADIFGQIVIESTVLAALGGVFGLGAALGLMRVLEAMSPVQNRPVVEPSAVIMSLTFAVGVGVLAGLYPAWRAAKLSPIEALRYE
ncbi:MAG: ABC transporter permease [Verrucomicrobiae bacterium]|nr:ABC transporter permease [Verrucomicrobiae bacterium]